jgi:hypothetical protein
MLTRQLSKTGTDQTTVQIWCSPLTAKREGVRSTAHDKARGLREWIALSHDHSFNFKVYMTNQLTISTESFSIARTSKSGKVSERGLLGLIISGNKEERLTTGKSFSLAMWECGQFKPIYKELARVFGGKAFDMSISMIGLYANAPTKSQMLMLLRGISDCFADAKGEKAIFADVATAIFAYEGKLENARIEREAAEEAKRLAGQ